MSQFEPRPVQNPVGTPGGQLLAPVFVVGAPRSGTTMLAAMLASHSSFAAGPETQFFSKLPFSELEEATRGDWPDKAVALLERLTLAGQPVIDLFETSPAGLHARLSTRSPSIGAMVESLTVPFSDRRGKRRWVEKTPNHILHLAKIRVLWPEARIVRIMRDPRDAAMSTCKLPTFSDSVLANIYLWLRWQRAAEPFLANDPFSLTVRYESLVDDPEAELARLCAFLGEPFESAMLEFGDAARDVTSQAESWKDAVAEGLTNARKFAWKSDFPAGLLPICNLACHEYLRQFDYDFEPAEFCTRTVFRLSSDYVERQEEFLIDQARQGIRWLPTDVPDQADWIVEQPEYGRFRNPRDIARLLYSRIKGLA